MNEIHTIEIQIPNDKNIIIGIIYRPPDLNIPAFINSFDSVLSKINSEGKKVWLTGDFNINLLNFNHHSLTNDFLNLLLSYSFFPLISKPTRITKNSKTLIDNIFCNCFNPYITSGLLVTDISDHFGIWAINSSMSYPTCAKPIMRRCGKEYYQFL